ncbi:hypothetical protein EG68_06431 [Paragonimus skrjabini miyazakii]|uniref:Uncharacterized protein n=1 Tax=Paragonimus skrjabini miyazakii TaxID=59628 RepID=A0A8S9Y951_9TREM|nr:hypothetical protein EG68_06431 [Paragonimus skrjabini miyazakii]
MDSILIRPILCVVIGHNLSLFSPHSEVAVYVDISNHIARSIQNITFGNIATGENKSHAKFPGINRLRSGCYKWIDDRTRSHSPFESSYRPNTAACQMLCSRCRASKTA